MQREIGSSNVEKKLSKNTPLHESSVKSEFPESKEQLSHKKTKDKKRIKLNIAVTPQIAATQDLSDLGEVKTLYCNLAMFISDMKTLVTLTNWPNQVALMTQDQGIIRAGRDYYDNPRCCGTKAKQLCESCG
jgi:hypothetical protein